LSIFFKQVLKGVVFASAIERLMRAIDTGSEATCSGHDYR